MRTRYAGHGAAGKLAAGLARISNGKFIPKRNGMSTSWRRSLCRVLLNSEAVGTTSCAPLLNRICRFKYQWPIENTKIIQEGCKVDTVAILPGGLLFCLKYAIYNGLAVTFINAGINVNPHLSTTLSLLGIGCFFVYFVLFAKTMKTLSAEDLEKHNSVSSPIKNLLSTVPIVAVFFTTGFLLTVSLATAAFIFAALQAVKFNEKLKNVGVSSEFVKRLNYISLVGGLSIMLIFSGVCYEQL